MIRRCHINTVPTPLLSNKLSPLNILFVPDEIIIALNLKYLPKYRPHFLLRQFSNPRGNAL